MDPCQAEVCACASLIWASGKERLHFLFSISSADSFSSQNKKALNKQMRVVFSVTFMSGQTSGRKYFQDVGVCACLLGVCLIWSASLLIIQAGVCRCCPSMYLLAVSPLCPFPGVSGGLSFRQQKHQQRFHSWHNFSNT